MKNVNKFKLLVIAIVASFQLSAVAGPGAAVADVAAIEADVFQQIVSDTTVIDATFLSTMNRELANSANLPILQALAAAKKAGVSIKLDLKGMQAFRAANKLQVSDMVSAINEITSAKGEDVSLDSISVTKTVTAVTARLQGDQVALAAPKKRDAGAEAAKQKSTYDQAMALAKDATALDAAFRNIALQMLTGKALQSAKLIRYSRRPEDVTLRQVIGLYALGAKVACEGSISIPDGSTCTQTVSNALNNAYFNIIDATADLKADPIQAAITGYLFFARGAGVDNANLGRALLGLSRLLELVGNQAWRKDEANRDGASCIAGLRVGEFDPSQAFRNN